MSWQLNREPSVSSVVPGTETRRSSAPWSPLAAVAFFLLGLTCLFFCPGWHVRRLPQNPARPVRRRVSDTRDARRPFVFFTVPFTFHWWSGALRFTVCTELAIKTTRWPFPHGCVVFFSPPRPLIDSSPQGDLTLFCCQQIYASHILMHVKDECYWLRDPDCFRSPFV